jgi:Leucine-rich repeat (LRR) protein
MAYNSIGGAIPASIDQAKSLSGLWLHNLNLTSSLPAEVGKLTNLKYLRFDTNLGIHGTIPSELGMLTNLEQLYLNGCTLKGSIPDSFERLRSMHKMKLNGNKLGGQLPPGLANLIKLTDLDLTDNEFSSTVRRDYRSECHTLTALTMVCCVAPFTDAKRMGPN